MGRNNIVGAWGESLAADYLKRKKYKICGMNYKCRFGELDIIACNKKYLTFVEVKLRKSDKFAAAADFVDAAKQERLRKTAALYLEENPTHLQPRFDVIEIYAPQGVATLKPTINHMEDAFQ